MCMMLLVTDVTDSSFFFSCCCCSLLLLLVVVAACVATTTTYANGAGTVVLDVLVLVPVLVLVLLLLCLILTKKWPGLSAFPLEKTACCAVPFYCTYCWYVIGTMTYKPAIGLEHT